MIADINSKILDRYLAPHNRKLRLISDYTRTSLLEVEYQTDITKYKERTEYSITEACLPVITAQSP
jgi:hypothetical protein